MTRSAPAHQERRDPEAIANQGPRKIFHGGFTTKTMPVTTTATADAIADATGTYISGGVKGLKNIIGTAYDTPTDGGFKRVFLRLPFNFG